jgi:iron complex outermembrane receptor protein
MNKFLLTLIFLLGLQNCFSQYTFSSRVTDDQKQPVPSVVVTLGKSSTAAVTDTNGYFSFQHATQNFTLTLSHVSFIPFTLRVNGTIQPLIVLNRNNDLLEETVVNAFERNGEANKVAASISVINKRLLERFGGQSLVTAVNTAPGVKMDERSPGSYRLSIRGNLLRSTFGVRNVKVYWNGIPFTDASGNTYLNLLSVNNLTKIEILKGPSGSMYGSGTGGVVLLSSGTTIQAKQKTIELQSSLGSYGLFSGGLSYQQSGKNNSTISFTHQQADGYRDHTNMRRDVLHSTGSYLLSNKHKLNSNIFLADLFYQTPGGLNLAELKANPKQARPAAGVFQSAATQKAAVHLKTLYAGVGLESRLAEHWKNTSSIYGSYTDFQNPTIRNYENKYERGAGGRTVFNYEHTFFSGVVGAEFQSGFFNAAVHGNKQGIKDTLQFRDAIRSRQFNIFAQTDFSLPWSLILSAGLSYNNFYYSYERVSNANATKQSNSFPSRFVPRVSLLKKLDFLNIYAAISKGYSVPTIDEIHAGNDEFNTSLKSETAINYEVGVKAEFIKNKLWMDASHYFFNLQNTIVSRRDSAGGDYYTNAGKTNQQGTELNLQYLVVNNNNRFLRQLKFTTAFTNVYARFKNYQQGTSKYDGKQLTGTTPNVLVANADIYTATGFYTNLGYSYTDHIPLNDANSFWATSYQLLFAKLGYKTSLGPSVDAHFFVTAEKSLNNPFSLGNDLNAAGNRFFNPSVPQQFNIGMQFKTKVKERTGSK